MSPRGRSGGTFDFLQKCWPVLILDPHTQPRRYSRTFILREWSVLPSLILRLAYNPIDPPFRASGAQKQMICPIKLIRVTFFEIIGSLGTPRRYPGRYI